MVKSVCNITKFAKSMLHNYIKVVRLKPDQPNQWLRACFVLVTLEVTMEHIAENIKKS